MRFRYSQIETAIAKMNGLPLDAATMKTFRTRIRNFQKIGLVPSTPGSGNKISYTMRDAAFWAVCIELAEAGFPPSIIKMIIDLKGKVVLDFFTVSRISDQGDLSKIGGDKYLLIAGNFVKWNLTDAKPDTARDLRVHTLESLLVNGMPDRATFVNLTSLKERLSDALAAVVTIEEPNSEEPGTITTARGY